MNIDCPLVIDGQPIAGKALDMIAVLMEKLHASVALQDVQRREAHIKMTDMWHCEATAPDEVPIGMRDPDGEQLVGADQLALEVMGRAGHPLSRRRVRSGPGNGE